MKATGGNAILRLRVMECSKCGATHREMPNGLIPYKQYSADMFCAICTGHLPESDEDDLSVDKFTSQERKDHADDIFMCDISIRQRIMKWLSWFLACVQAMDEIHSDQISISESICGKLKSYIRVIVNSGKWKQHHFAMTRF